MSKKFINFGGCAINFIVVAFFICVGVSFFLDYKHTDEFDVKILKEFSEVNTSGSITNGDGHVHTSIDYYVITDKGIFSIEHGGLYGNSEFGTLEVDRCYHIQTRGYRNDVLKIYPKIVSHKLLDYEY